MANTTRKVRKSPSESATLFPEGTMKKGWVVKKAANGVQRWIPEVSVEMNGFKKFTVDHAAKKIGKTITLYAREYSDMWPSKNAWTNPENSTYVRFLFTPNGAAGVMGKKMNENWLKTRTPAIKDRTMFVLDGKVSQCTNALCKDPLELPDGLMVDSVGKKMISSNFMNTEVFVKY